MRLVWIEFADHYAGSNDWADLDKEAGEPLVPMLCQSVGWVVAEDDRTVKLVANLDGKPDEADNGFGFFSILKSDIVRRVRLHVPPTAPKKGQRRSHG